jgi:putative transposase
MNREVHVRFWKSVGLRCPTPLTYLHASETLSEACVGIGRYLDFYNNRRPDSSLDRQTPDQAYFNALTPMMVAA